MNLKQKLLTGFLTITTLLIIISGITYVQLNTINNQYSSTIEEGNAKVHLTTEALFANYKQEIALQTYLATDDSESLDEFYNQGAEFREMIANLKAQTNHEEGVKLTEQIELAEAEYSTVTEEGILYKQAGDTEAYLALMEDSGAEIIERIHVIGGELLAYHEDSYTRVSNELT